MNEKLEENGIEESYEKRLAIYKKSFENRLNLVVRAVKKNRGDFNNSELLESYLGDFETKIAKLLPERVDEFSQVVESIKIGLKEQGEDGKIRLTARKLSEFLAKNISLVEFEELSRQGKDLLTNLDTSKSIKLNRLLIYRIEGSTVIIDIPTTFIEKPSELKILFIDGMKELARRLKEDPNLEKAAKIIGYAWMIFESPKIVERLGFTITNVNPEVGTGSAEISREKLIELYGN